MLRTSPARSSHSFHASRRAPPRGVLLLALSALSSLAAACGGLVVFDGVPDGGAGGASGGAGGSDPGGAGGVGPGGGGGVGGVGGVGGSCARTYEGFAMSIGSSSGSPGLDCASAQPGSSTYQHIDGVVLSTWSEGFSIDTCPPNMDCGVSLVFDVWISAPDLWFDTFEGQFVQLDVLIDYPWGCSQTLMVRNLPEWNGAASPAGPEAFLVVAGSDGHPYALDGSPFTVSPQALGCVGIDQGCGIEDDYLLEFYDAYGPVPVYQGETRPLELGLPSGAMQPALARNLRSFETGWCDDYWNWGYWVAPAYLD